MTKCFLGCECLEARHVPGATMLALPPPLPPPSAAVGNSLVRMQPPDDSGSAMDAPASDDGPASGQSTSPSPATDPVAATPPVERPAAAHRDRPPGEDAGPLPLDSKSGKNALAHGDFAKSESVNKSAAKFAASPAGSALPGWPAAPVCLQAVHSPDRGSGVTPGVREPAGETGGLTDRPKGVGSTAATWTFYPITASSSSALSRVPVQVAPGSDREATPTRRAGGPSASDWHMVLAGCVPAADGPAPNAPPTHPQPKESALPPVAPNDPPRMGWQHLAPASLGVLLAVTGEPRDPAERGYEYLCNYTRRSIATAERRIGPLRDHDDIVHQVCVEWLEQAGPPYVAFPRLLEGQGAEMELLRQVVSRVIARSAYHQRRNWVALGETDAPAPADAAGGDWVDFRADHERGVGNLSPTQWQVLEYRREGLTFDEIGAALRLPRQRVWDLYHAAIVRLREIYQERGE